MELLNKLIKEGHIFLYNGEYVGIASDGIQVWMGSEGHEAYIIAFLVDYPTPDTW